MEITEEGPSMDKIRFLHIPKTAGTTFLDCLRQVYGDKTFIFSGRTAEDLERYRTIEAAERKQIVVFSGHSPRVTGEEEVDCVPIVTFLRDPVSRVRSFCQHVSEGKSPYLLERFPPDRFDLDAFLHSGNGELENMHTRFILGEETYELPVQDPDVLVDRALDVLVNDIQCFGIVERFEESLLLFCHEFGWKWPRVRRLNQRNRSRLIQFNGEQIAWIRELNAVDIRVYEAASRIFQEQVENKLDHLNSKRLLFSLYQAASLLRDGAYHLVNLARSQ